MKGIDVIHRDDTEGWLLFEIPTEAVDGLIQEVAEELPQLAEVLATLSKHVESSPYESNRFVVGIKDEDARGAAGFTPTEAVAFALAEEMLDTLAIGARFGLGLQRTGWVDANSHDGQAILEDLEDPDDPQVDNEVWKL